MAIRFTKKLQKEYRGLFDSCTIRPEKQRSVEKTLDDIDSSHERYAAVGDRLGIPWYLVGIIHCMESSMNFKTHLHNGDSLKKRTVHTPRNRPKIGDPPFEWEESAVDALQLKGLQLIAGWSLPRILFELERYNGFGYRKYHPEILSPYLWSFSLHYDRGKYRADGIFSPMLRSKQCGGASLLKAMTQRKLIQFDDEGS